jgi:hypothetical protein
MNKSAHNTSIKATGNKPERFSSMADCPRALLNSLHAMNKIIIITLFGLVTASAAFADTKWETYLGAPTPENAVRVKAIEYTPGKIPDTYGYWAPDLIILQDQIIGGDSEAFRLAYRLREEAQGGLLEELTILLSRVIRARPEFFLKEMSGLQPTEEVLKGVLLMPGQEYVDRLTAQKYEIKMRTQSLAAVKTKKLIKFRNRCIKILEKGM